MIIIGQKINGTIPSMKKAIEDQDQEFIRKNIFKSISEAAGFEVYDLGIDTPADAFVNKVKKVHPEINRDERRP